MRHRFDFGPPEVSKYSADARTLPRDHSPVIPSGFESRRPHQGQANGTSWIDIAMTDSGKNLHLAAAALLAAMLAGCTSGGGTADDQAGSLLVAPDKFAIYNCPQLADRAAHLTNREKELRELIAKAGTGPDGRFASAVAYQPEYLSVRGEINELHAAVAAKKCKFVPGEKLGGKVSDKVIR